MMARALPLRAGATVALIVGMGVATPALAQGRLTVDVAASGGVADNPFLETGSTPVTGSVTVQVSPTYQFDMDLTRFTLGGSATLTQYLERYRNSDSFMLSGAGVHQINSRSALRAQLGYTNSVVGAFNDVGLLNPGIVVPGQDPITPAVAPIDAATGLPLPATPTAPTGISDLLIDPSLGGIGGRRQTYTAGAGYSTGLGPRDRVDLDLTVVGVRSGGATLNDFNYVTQRIGYRRAIRQGFDVTAGLVVGRSDYLRQRLSDATTLQPTVGASYVLAEGVSLNLSVGVSIVRSNLAVAGARTTTSLSAQGSVCKQDARSNACFSLSRAAVPSSLGGVRVQTAASVSGTMRVSERGSVSLGGIYSRSGQPLGDLTTLVGPSWSRTDFYSARGDYSHRLSPRLSGFVSTGISRADESRGVGRDASYDLRTGVRLRLGAIR